MAKIYCSNCGQLIPEDSNFCRFCGAPQRGQESSLYRALAAPLARATVPALEVRHTDAVPAAHHKMLREVIPRRQLSPRAVWLFFINYNFRMAILIPAFAVGIYLEPLVAIFFFAFQLLVFLVASLIHSSFYFSIDHNGFQVEYGIIHKRRVSLPFRQIQNVNILRTFIERSLGIARLEVETAGSSSIKKRDIIGGIRSKSEGVLPGVSMADAQHLHDLLLQKKEYQHLSSPE